MPLLRRQRARGRAPRRPCWRRRPRWCSCTARRAWQPPPPRRCCARCAAAAGRAVGGCRTAGGRPRSFTAGRACPCRGWALRRDAGGRCACCGRHVIPEGGADAGGGRAHRPRPRYPATLTTWTLNWCAAHAACRRAHAVSLTSMQSGTTHTSMLPIGGGAAPTCLWFACAH
jgi:hypothetical protein